MVEQINAVTKAEGPCTILAGAGTGKTHTIVEKIKYLIKEKIYLPERIVCITFSNEAANNLLIRLQRALEFKGGKEPIIRTFHAFSADLLRKYFSKVEVKEDFKILDPDQAKVVLHRHLKIQPYYCHKYVASIGTAKDLGISLESLQSYIKNKIESFEGIELEKRLENLQFELQTLHLNSKYTIARDKKRILLEEIRKISSLLDLKKFVSAWSAYEKIKTMSNYLDYSDLNIRALDLLEKYPEIAKEFSYIIVDEFQDTNKLQLDFLLYLAAHGNITIVGDMNQSIYRFRGAYKENFNIFKKHFNINPGEIFNLDKSRRSPNKVLRAAHKLILNNYENKEDCFMVENFEDRDGEKIEIYELNNAKEEARKAADIVEKELADGRKSEEICIMFRTHQQGRIIKKMLESRGISYKSATKKPLLKQAAIKTAIDYLTIIDKLKRKDKGGEEAWWDLIYQLDFLEEDLLKIGKFIKDNKDKEQISEFLLSKLTELPLSNSGRLSAKIVTERIKKMLESALNTKDASELVRDVCIIAGMVSETKDLRQKEVILNLNKFYELCQEHSTLYSPDLPSFLRYLDILGNLEIEIEAADMEKAGVQLMTLHATKGLEYDVVIITNMAQKRFPIERIESNNMIPIALYPEMAALLEKNTEDFELIVKDYERRHQLYEERRLCYVAFTRTRKKLILTYSQEYGGKKFMPSQFLNEILYKENNDIDFFIDDEDKYVEPKLEMRPASKFGYALHSNEFDELLVKIVKDSERNMVKVQRDENRAFSPSALLTFVECQKKFEYHYVYNMPEKKTISWDALRLGSFAHLIFEQGVKKNFRTIKEFLNLARELHLQEEWQSVDFSDAEHLVKIFFERNKDKYDEHSRTEQLLKINLEGVDFVGFADRIDFRDDGVEIIDYKTGKQTIAPLHRRWQMGYYALAAASLFGKVKKITLDMLKQEKPLEFEIDERGNALSLYSDMSFNVHEVQEELVSTAKQILDAYDKGFKPCPIEKNCEFCNEYVYGL